MSTNTYYIEHDGKQLRTFNELKSWFETTVKKEKKKNPTYNENQLASTERTTVVALINELIPTDNEGRLFKIALFQYLVQVLYRSIHTAMYPTKLPQDIFMEHLSWFDKQFEIIKDEKLQKQFLQNQIARTERISLDWTNHVDLTDPLFKHIFDAGQMFLSLLKTKITNYQHTPIASAHEKIIREHYYDECGLPISDNSILLAEYLEDRLIAEGVAYKRALDDNWMSLVFDKEYFKKFIPGALLNEFKQIIFDRTHPLNDREINKLLTLSLDQFKVMNPANREAEFIKKFAHAHWFPNRMDKVYESEMRPAKFILAEFAIHYNLFVDAVQTALNDFRNNKLGSTTTFIQPPFPETSNNISVMTNQFILQKNFGTNHISFGEILDEATENGIIEFIHAADENELYTKYKSDFRNWLAKQFNQTVMSDELFKIYCHYKNFEQFIMEYSHPDYDNTPFRSPYGLPFENVFNEAVFYELVDAKNESEKSGLYSYYDLFFTEWLRHNFNIPTEAEYNKHCTFDNFKKFLKEERVNEKAAREKHAQDKLQHQIDVGLIDPPSSNDSLEKDNSNDNDSITFDSLLTKDKADFVLTMLENLTITKDGKPIVSQRKKSLLLGIVDALRDKNILPQLGVQVLCKIIATKIGLELNSKLNSSFQSDEMHKRANQYIKDYYKF